MKFGNRFQFKSSYEGELIHEAEYVGDEKYFIKWHPNHLATGIVEWDTASSEEISNFTGKPDGWVILKKFYNDSPIISDGGSSNYYKLTITNKAGESIQCETGDVLRVLVGNDYDLSNIVKACRRMYEASQGRGKAGASIEYDANKIVYFANEFKHWNKEI